MASFQARCMALTFLFARSILLGDCLGARTPFMVSMLPSFPPTPIVRDIELMIMTINDFYFVTNLAMGDYLSVRIPLMIVSYLPSPRPHLCGILY